MLDNLSENTLKETLISSSEVFKGDFINVVNDTVCLSNGMIATREYVKHTGATAIIAITHDGQIILEYQYRHPVKQIMLEIPAGKLEFNEPPLDCAKRELQEETGYTSDNWHLLGECYPCIGYSNERIIYYLALNVIAGIPSPDEGEFVESIAIPFNDILQKIYTGVINDSKTLSGIMLYLGFLHQSQKE